MPANRKRKMLLLASTAASFLALAGPAWGGAIKVAVCHVPPGDPDQLQTIVVGAPAVRAHLAHGDQLGECPSGCLLDVELCDDENACTVDVCLADGSCDNSATVDCDDGRWCTNDACDAIEGCVHHPRVGVACDDSDVCTAPDVCNVDGNCSGQPLPGCCYGNADCEDGDLCTINTCNTETGECVQVNVDCSAEGDLCNIPFCVDGSCQTTPVNCDDGEPCTSDACDPVQGCIHTLTPECSCPCWSEDNLLELFIEYAGELPNVCLPDNGAHFHIQAQYSGETLAMASVDYGEGSWCGGNCCVFQAPWGGGPGTENWRIYQTGFADVQLEDCKAVMRATAAAAGLTCP